MASEERTIIAVKLAEKIFNLARENHDVPVALTSLVMALCEAIRCVGLPKQVLDEAIDQGWADMQRAIEQEKTVN